MIDFSTIPQNALFAIAGTFVLLVTATTVRHVLIWSSPSKDYTELKQRIQSWWWMISILVLCLFFGKKTSIFIFAFISFLALKEFLSIVPLRITDRRAIFWIYLALPLQYYWAYSGWYGMFIIFIPIYVFLLIPARLMLIGNTDGFIKSAGVLHWAIMLTVYSLSHIAYIFVLPEKSPLSGNTGIVLFLLFTTQFNDVCQYLWGKMLGQHKIVPQVSPNKTWEGFIGGVVSIVIISGFLAPYLTPLSWIQGLGAGAIISVSGFIGDTVLSSVKRDLHIKDTGRLIPGHGGMLDRIDSLTYTAPLFFHYLYYSSY